MDKQEIKGEVGNYRVTFSPALGRGVFGTVHKAVHIRTKEELAAKQLILSGGKNEKDRMLQMAKEDLDVIHKVQGHKNIVRLYDHMHVNKAYWIFMELCEIGDLHDYMESNRTINFQQKIEILHQSVSAVAYMHSRQPPIVHRDIKPKTIMLKRMGRDVIVKLTDFGFSRLLDDRQSLSVHFGQGALMSSLCGSQYFMAPEFSAELERGLKYDKSVDTFALGLVCLVLLQCETYRDLLPVSVDKRRLGTYVSIGYEMSVCYKERKSLPTVVCTEKVDSLEIRRLKRIIVNMTRFNPTERKNIEETEHELAELLEQLNISNVNHKPSRNENPKTMAEEQVATTGATKLLHPTRLTSNWARVLFAYEAENDDELSIDKGQIIFIIDKNIMPSYTWYNNLLKELDYKGWWKGEQNNKLGVFPSNFVELLPADVKIALVEHTYKALYEDELTINEGQKIIVSQQEIATKGWWRGELNNKVGVFPNNFVKLLPAEVKIALVAHSYQAENDDELSITKGQSVFVLQELEDEGWWRGGINNKVGIFPNNYVVLLPAKEAVALVEYARKAENEDELSIEEGQKAMVLQQETGDDGWWMVELNGKVGLIPNNFVKLL